MGNKPTSLSLWTIEHVLESLNQAESNAIPRALSWMANIGQRVMLGWGDDTNLWECTWITGGKRYTGTGENITMAVVACLLKVKHRNDNATA